MTQPDLPGGLRVVGEPRAGVCGTWWRALAANGAERGVLRPDLDGADAGAAERLTAAVRAVSGLSYSGFLTSWEPVRHGGALWIVTTQPASPTLIELAQAGIRGIDIGSVATIASETGQSLSKLHNAGLAHGWVHGQTVVVTSTGAAKLAETALSPALRSTPADAATDRRMWAELIRGMVAQWGDGGSGAELMLRCAEFGAQDLDQALEVLRFGAYHLPPEYGKRAGLVAAVASYQGAGAPVAPADIPQQTPGTSPPASTVAPAPVSTVAAAPAEPAPSHQQATRLARRPGGTPVMGHAESTPAPAVDSGGEVRFGPGVPAAAPPPAWRPPPPARRRGSPWRLISSILSTLLTLVLLAAVGWYFWQRISPLAVTSVTVAAADPPADKCDVTVDVVATVQTNGNAGTIKYQWLRSGAEPSGVLTEQVGRGQRSVALHLKWTFSGVGSAQETATINITEPSPMQAETSVTYNCRRP